MVYMWLPAGTGSKRARELYMNSVKKTITSRKKPKKTPKPKSPSTSTAKNKVDEPIDESVYKGKIHALLKKIPNTGKGGNEFAISGQLTQVPIMLISIKDGGVMHFPMYEDETQKVIDAFEKSPFGKGTKTVLDPSVRNSWQLNPSGFKISNPKWELYMKDVLLPRIGKEMEISTPFTASLYKLLIYKTGSFFKTHRDSEKEDRMFGTLVVQLPSNYTGGQLVVSHDNKTKTMDFSSSADPTNEFEMFYSAFYCDCEHEILPLTSGVRVCLIYNLILTKTKIPIPVAPRVSEAQGQLYELLKDWEVHNGPSKIVYFLSHRYTSKSFSMDNLKSADKNIAQVLLKFSKQNDFTVLMGIFEKESAGYAKGMESDSDFDSDDEDCYCEKKFTLKELKPLEDTQEKPAFDLKSLSVCDEEELIPEKCFKNESPYNKTSSYTGNEGVEVSLFYRGAALVIFPNENIIEILIHNKSIDAAEKMFLEEFEKFREKKKTAKPEAKIRRWLAQFSIMYPQRRDVRNAVPMLSAIIYLNDLELLQNHIGRYTMFKNDMIPLIVSQCEKFGWKSLVSQLSGILKTYADGDSALRILRLFMKGGLEKDKKTVCQQLAQVVLGLPKKSTSSSYYPYSFLPRVKTLEEKQLELENDKNFLFEFCQTAKKINFNVLEHTTKLSVRVVGPVLMKLGNAVANTLDKYWLEVGKHWLEKMEQIAAKSAAIPNWKFTDYKPCGCKDCVAVNAFMTSDKASQGFKMGKVRRVHIIAKLSTIKNVSHQTELTGSPQKLVITKFSGTDADDAEEQKLSRELLPKLKAMIGS